MRHLPEPLKSLLSSLLRQTAFKFVVLGTDLCIAGYTGLTGD
jgi:hypothetical protein